MLNKSQLGQIGAVVALTAVAVITNSTILEIVACLSGLLCVWLNAKENIWNYPIGYVNAICFAFMFYDAKLYADMTLQIIFGVLMAYGWYIWLTKRKGNTVRPTIKFSRGQMAVTLVGTVIFALGWGYFLHQLTDAAIPYLDALIASLSVAAQFLLSRKVVQSWYLWITVDVLSVGMYAYKGLYMVSALYGVFLVIAIYGLIEWKREMDWQKACNQYVNRR